MTLMPIGGAWLLFAAAMQIAVLVLVVLGIVWLVRRLSGDSSGSRAAPSAMDELERRYARGEIDRTTYLQMRDDLAKLFARDPDRGVGREDEEVPIPQPVDQGQEVAEPAIGLGGGQVHLPAGPDPRRSRHGIPAQISPVNAPFG